jgi:sulfur-oxidizing protein SoxX
MWRRLALAACVAALASPPVARAQPGPAGDVERGRQLLADRTQSLCLLCHSLTAGGDPNEGNLAPPLDGIARRLTRAGLRERIADMRRFNPATVMPPFRSTQGLREVAPAWQGRAALTEQQLDDLVAYLATLAAP